MNEIHKHIINSPDLEIISTLPIKHINIFVSKMVSIFVKILFSTIILIVPVYVATALNVQTLFTDSFVIIAIIVAIFAITFISIFLSSIFGIIYSLVVKFLSNKFLIKMLLFVIIIGVGFYYYSSILVFFKNFIETGDFKFAFNYGLITEIKNLNRYLVFANNIGEIVVRINTMHNFFIILVSELGLGILSFIIIFLLFKKAITGNSKSYKIVYRNKTKFESSGIMGNLIKKEFIQVYRSSNYSFQYFVIALIVPLMTFTMVNISSEIVFRILAIDATFEISLFALLLFSCLTNTFCATNISREGKMMNELKTMPITPKQIVYSKVWFCSIITISSILITTIVILAFGYISVIQAILLFISATLIGLSQILFSTKMDLKKPNYPEIEGGEVVDSNQTTSIIIILSLVLSVVVGAILIFLKVVYSFVLKSSIYEYLPIGVVIIISFVLFLLSRWYLNFNLEKLVWSGNEK
jgi:ABC-2 type transport system permease protein